MHCLDNFWDALIHLAEDLVALRLVVLDEVSTHPESIACLAERLWLQSQFWLDDCAHDQSTIFSATSKDAPHIHHAARRAVKQTEIGWWKIDVIDLSILHITHALVVSNGQRQD